MPRSFPLTRHCEERSDEAIQKRAPALIDFASLAAVRHCEERSDEAIQKGAACLDCFASLAMTAAEFCA
jgi:hypothetical protein